MIFPSRSIENGCQFQGGIKNGQVSVDKEKNGHRGDLKSPKLNTFQLYSDEILEENECYARIRSLSRQSRIPSSEALT